MTGLQAMADGKTSFQPDFFSNLLNAFQYEKGFVTCPHKTSGTIRARHFSKEATPV